MYFGVSWPHKKWNKKHLVFYEVLAIITFHACILTHNIHIYLRAEMVWSHYYHWVYYNKLYRPCPYTRHSSHCNCILYNTSMQYLTVLAFIEKVIRNTRLYILYILKILSKVYSDLETDSNIQYKQCWRSNHFDPWKIGDGKL